MMICTIVFLSLYGSVTFTGLFYLENKYGRTLSTFKARKEAMERILDFVNFVNAVTATILSSIVLCTMDSSERTDMRGRTHSKLATWTIESVCAYLIVEMTLFSVSSFRLSKSSWNWVKECYKETVAFHIVAFLGLISVLLTGVGYSVAMWVIWSELTSIFLGLQAFLEVYRLHRTRAHYVRHRAVWLFDIHFSKSTDIFVFIVALLGAVYYRISIYHPIHQSRSWNHSQHSISVQFVLLALQTDNVIIL